MQCNQAQNAICAHNCACMKYFLIKYQFKSGLPEAWHGQVRTMIHK